MLFFLNSRRSRRGAPAGIPHSEGTAHFAFHRLPPMAFGQRGQCCFLFTPGGAASRVRDTMFRLAGCPRAWVWTVGRCRTFASPTFMRGTTFGRPPSPLTPLPPLPVRGEGEFLRRRCAPPPLVPPPIGGGAGGLSAGAASARFFPGHGLPQWTRRPGSRPPPMDTVSPRRGAPARPRQRAEKAAPARQGRLFPPRPWGRGGRGVGRITLEK